VIDKLVPISRMYIDHSAIVVELSQKFRGSRGGRAGSRIRKMEGGWRMLTSGKVPLEKTL
jgi:hypothetical protein